MFILDLISSAQPTHRIRSHLYIQHTSSSSVHIYTLINLESSHYTPAIIALYAYNSSRLSSLIFIYIYTSIHIYIPRRYVYIVSLVQGTHTYTAVSDLAPKSSQERSTIPRYVHVSYYWRIEELYVRRLCRRARRFGARDIWFKDRRDKWTYLPARYFAGSVMYCI